MLTSPGAGKNLGVESLMCFPGGLSTHIVSAPWWWGGQRVEVGGVVIKLIPLRVIMEACTWFPQDSAPCTFFFC